MYFLVLVTSGSSLASTYSTHWNLKFTSNTNYFLVKISRVDRTSEIPCVTGDPFRYSKAKYKICITNFLGGILYGILEVTDLQSSLITGIIHYISITFYLVVVFLIFAVPTSSLNLSNSLYMRIMLNKNPPLAYRLTTLVRKLSSYLAIRVGVS